MHLVTADFLFTIYSNWVPYVGPTHSCPTALEKLAYGTCLLQRHSSLELVCTWWLNIAWKRFRVHCIDSRQLGRTIPAPEATWDWPRVLLRIMEAQFLPLLKPRFLTLPEALLLRLLPQEISPKCTSEIPSLLDPHLTLLLTNSILIAAAICRLYLLYHNTIGGISWSP